MLKRIYMVLILGAALSCHAKPAPIIRVPGSPDLQPDEQLSAVCKLVTEMISRSNYKKVEINDSLSTVIYNAYIKIMDENHNYLLASDIKDFEKYKTVLDDDLKAGNLNDAFYIFNVYEKRYIERVKYSLAQLDKPYDFNTKEAFTFDRDNLPWAASETEMNAIWDKRVKYDLLSLKLAGSDMAKNKETLKKRYENMLTQANKLNNQDVFQLFMDAFTNSVDPHTNYFNPSNAANFNIDMSRSLEGIGASLLLENEFVTIKSVVPGGPADKSKQITTDDRIVGVAQGKTGEFTDVIGWRIENAIALIRGTKGTTVRLKLLSKGKGTSEKPKIVEMVREKIILQDQSAKEEIRTYNNNGKITRVGVISIPTFYMDFNDYKSGNPNYKSTTRDVKLIIDTLKQKNVDGIVIDLRGNPGGSLMEAIELGGLFIKTGPIVQVRDTRNKVEVNEDEDPSISWTGPLGVIVDRSSASASEIFAGAMQDYGRAIIMGTQTYGKGTVQSALDLDSWISPSVKDMLANLVHKNAKPGTGSQSTFGQLNLTIAKFYRISGNSTQHKGVIPDISFPSLIPLDKYGEDIEKSALPFDMIEKSNYTKVGDFSQVLPQLTKLHDQRSQTNLSYKYLNEDIADFRKNENQKSVTLNEQELKAQRDSDDQKAFERTNLKRIAMGYPALKKGDKKAKTDDLDFLKIEAGQILSDYISLDNKFSSTVH